MEGFYKMAEEKQAACNELLDTLKDITRIVVAFSYTNQLGKSQQERLDKALNVISKHSKIAEAK